MDFLTRFLWSQLFITPQLPNRSFSDEMIVLTGANRGLGLEAARQFVQLCASKVILAVRNVNRGETADADIERTENCVASTIEVWDLDMSSCDSVKAFVERLITLSRLDALIASAGMMADIFSLTEGRESTVTINVISTFLLALLSLPKLKDSASRVNTRPHLCVVVSDMHYWADLAAAKSEAIFDALDDRDQFDGPMRCQDAKVIQMVVLRELISSYIKSPESYPVIINTSDSLKGIATL
jgi:retinol dehydrogenase 12